MRTKSLKVGYQFKTIQKADIVGNKKITQIIINLHYFIRIYHLPIIIFTKVGYTVYPT